MKWLVSLLFNRKSLLAFAFVAGIFGTGYYINGVMKERDALEVQVNALQFANQRNAELVEEQTKRHEATLASYNEAMSFYVNATAESTEHNLQLKYNLETLSNEKLRMCMDTGVDAEFLDRLFDYPTNKHRTENSN